MLCTIETQHPFVVMDYGTADGRNFITVLPRILGKTFVLSTNPNNVGAFITLTF